MHFVEKVQTCYFGQGLRKLKGELKILYANTANIHWHKFSQLVYKLFRNYPYVDFFYSNVDTKGVLLSRRYTKICNTSK